MRHKEWNKDIGSVPLAQRLVAEELRTERTDELEASDDRSAFPGWPVCWRSVHIQLSQEDEPSSNQHSTIPYKSSED